MNKRITITIETETGDRKHISSFSNNKIEHITDTKQWEYVLQSIIKGWDDVNNNEGKGPIED